MKRRKPWLSFVLTQICPGLGQLYNGQPGWALFAFLLSLVVTLFSTIFLFDSLNKLLLAIAVGLALDLWLSVQAWLASRRIKEMELKRYQRWWVYLLFTVVVYGLPDGYGYLYPSRIRSFQIPSESMVPNLLIGDRLVADGWSYWRSEPQRGDVVVFQFPRDPSIIYVKRLVGLPGDKVEVVRGELYVNDHLMPEQRVGEVRREDGERAYEYRENLEGVVHTIYRASPDSGFDIPAEIVPAGKYFMMGDNRDRSSDSRVWGFVSRDQIIGRMNYIYFSWDTGAFHRALEENPADITHAILAGIRRDRLGMPVR